MSPPRLRCAIYTRKSSDEGLDQDFNSLHAQRDACEALVRVEVQQHCVHPILANSRLNKGRPSLKSALKFFSAALPSDDALMEDAAGHWRLVIPVRPVFRGG